MRAEFKRYEECRESLLCGLIQAPRRELSIRACGFPSNVLEDKQWGSLIDIGNLARCLWAYLSERNRVASSFCER